MEYEELRAKAFEHRDRAILEGWWENDRVLEQYGARYMTWTGCPFCLEDMPDCECGTEHPKGWCDIEAEYDDCAFAWRQLAKEHPEKWEELVVELGLIANMEGDE